MGTTIDVEIIAHGQYPRNSNLLRRLSANDLHSADETDCNGNYPINNNFALLAFFISYEHMKIARSWPGYRTYAISEERFKDRGSGKQSFFPYWYLTESRSVSALSSFSWVKRVPGRRHGTWLLPCYRPLPAPVKNAGIADHNSVRCESGFRPLFPHALV